MPSSPYRHYDSKDNRLSLNRKSYDSRASGTVPDYTDHGDRSPSAVVFDHIEESAGKTLNVDMTAFNKISHKRLGLGNSIDVHRTAEYNVRDSNSSNPRLHTSTITG